MAPAPELQLPVRLAARATPVALLAAAALLFAGSAAATIAGCSAMAAGGMPMPGGWTMSMAWMRMPGQTWAGAAASFEGMWVVMMVAMMLPSLVSMLRRWRRAVAEDAPRLDGWTVLAGAGYFAIWAALGAALFPAGAALAALEMREAALARAVPAAMGAVVLLAGALQLAPWKARHLACCRRSPARGRLPAGPRAAFGHGLRLGLDCVRCCAGPTAALLALGVMDLRVMAAVTAAVTAERLAPAGERVARAIGWAAVAGGAALLARGLGGG